MGEKYIVPETVLKNLIRSSITLNALDYGGVENWEFFQSSIREYLDIAESIYNSSFEDISELIKWELEKFYKKDGME